MTYQQIREALIRLTGGDIPRSVKYVTALLYGLRKDKYIMQFQQTQAKIICTITDEGRENLRSRLKSFGIYDGILHKMTQTGKLPKINFANPQDFEKAFDFFLERSAYNHAQDALFSLIREAYKAGRRAAEGEAPDPKITAILDQRPRNAEDILY